MRTRLLAIPFFSSRGYDEQFEDSRCEGDYHAATRCSYSHGGEGGDQRARAARSGLRLILHATDGCCSSGGRLSEAFSVRQRPERHRGYMAVMLCVLLLAQWTRAQQCPKRRRSSTMGHQGQGGGDARLRAVRRQVQRGSGGVRDPSRTKPCRVRGTRPHALGTRFPSHQVRMGWSVDGTRQRSL